MSVWTWVALCLAGGAGAVARVVVSAAMGRAPLGTLVVNVSGAFALGVLSGAGVSEAALAIGGTGFLGGYTTFSTWMLETRDAAPRRPGVAVANVVASIVLGVGAVWLGRTAAG